MVGGIGAEAYDEMDVYKGTMEVGYWLGQEYWGKGIATEAVRVFVEDTLLHVRPNVVRLQAKVFSRNLASAKVLRKNGFELEGVLRSSYEKHGMVGDTLLLVRTFNPSSSSLLLPSFPPLFVLSLLSCSLFVSLTPPVLCHAYFGPYVSYLIIKMSLGEKVGVKMIFVS